MSDVDKWLEEMTAEKWLCHRSVAIMRGQALAAALLRARKVLRLIASEVEMLDYPGAAKEALADPELEELLR